MSFREAFDNDMKDNNGLSCFDVSKEKEERRESGFFYNLTDLIFVF